jgi:pSer/pThr/pTyr-binding forkhead associated (FHA) protein
VLVFANYPAISREHSVIHENKANGQWTIEDRDSANGTFVNGKQLEPFDKFVPLKHGDVIELAEVQRGGIKFRFELPDNDGSDGSSSKKSRNSGTQSKGDETVSDDDEIRSTHRFQAEKPAKNSNEKPVKANARPVEDEDDDIDPSQQTF